VGHHDYMAACCAGDDPLVRVVLLPPEKQQATAAAGLEQPLSVVEASMEDLLAEEAEAESLPNEYFG